MRPSGTGTARAPDVSIAPTKFGQAGEGISASSPGPSDEAGRDLDRMHAADGDEEVFGPERQPSRRRAVNAGHVAGDRLAQLRNAGLGGVEGLAAVDRRLGRLGRRRTAAAGRPRRPRAGSAPAGRGRSRTPRRCRSARRRGRVGRISSSQLRSGSGAMVMGLRHGRPDRGSQGGQHSSWLAARSSRIGQSGRSSPQQACDQRGERLGHRLHFGDARLEFGDMAFGDAPDLAARTRPVAPQRQKRGDLSRRKAEPARPLDEPQLVHLALAVVAIGVRRAARRAATGRSLRNGGSSWRSRRSPKPPRRCSCDNHSLDLPTMGRSMPWSRHLQGRALARWRKTMSLVETEKAVAKDPVCGMSVDPATAQHSFEHDGKTYYFCCAGCRTKFAADPARYLGADGAVGSPSMDGRSVERPMDRVGRDQRSRLQGRRPRHDLHLPDASGNPAGRTRLVPDLRHGARTGDAVGGGRPERRADRHEAPALVCAGAGGPAGRSRHGRPCLAAGMADAGTLELDRASARDPGRARRRLAVLRARLGLGPHPQPQHVHPDRDRRRRRLDLQRRRDGRARPLSRRVRPSRRAAGLFRGCGGHHAAW